MAAENSKEFSAICCAAAFSALFVLMALGIWEKVRYVVWSALFAGTAFWLLHVPHRWRKGTRQWKVAAILACDLLVDYWMWAGFAHYQNVSSYLILALEESARLACLVLLARFFCGVGGVAKAVRIGMTKFFLIAFPLIMLSGRGYSERIEEISHPLYLYPLLAMFAVHLNVFAQIIARYNGHKDSEAQESAES